MNFTKVTLSLVMICSMAQASQPQDTQTQPDTQKMEIKKPKRRSCCSYVTRAITVATITAIALTGWELHKSIQLKEIHKNFSKELTNCVNTCNQSELDCYDTCAKRLFPVIDYSKMCIQEDYGFLGNFLGTCEYHHACNDAKEGSSFFDGCFKRSRRRTIGQDYRGCRGYTQSYDNPQSKYNSKQCVLAVVKHAETVRNIDPNGDIIFFDPQDYLK